MKILIVGGVAGGASAAARLRRLDEQAEIILFEKGEFISYANCGLPYYIGDVITEKEKLLVQTPEAFQSRFNLEVRIFSEVITIDREAKSVTVRDHRSKRDYTENYDRLILSPGAEPKRPPLPGLDLPGIFTLRTVPDTYKIRDFVDNHPVQHAVVIGGGFIGVEMAENLKHRGMEVSLVEFTDQLVASMDLDMAMFLHAHVRQNGVRLFFQAGAAGFTQDADGRLVVRLTTGLTLTCDLVIMSIGIAPDSHLAKEAGLELGLGGSIKVDEYLFTSDPDILAVGDAIEIRNFVTGKPGLIPLAGPANKQGRIAAENALGGRVPFEGVQGTAVLKVFDMTAASTGLNEKQARREEIVYEKTYIHPLNHAGYFPGASQLAMKMLYDPADGRILGAQAVGMEGVEKRIDVLATAQRLGATVFDLEKLELSYAPPFSSAKDPVNMLGFTAANEMKGDVKVFHFHDVMDLDPDKVMLLDVRTPEEFEIGSIQFARNIPLDSLRARLAEVPKTKPIYVFCQVGLRGYLAARILTQNGYPEVYNLSGGYRLYHMMTREVQPDVPFDCYGQNLVEGEGEKLVVCPVVEAAAPEAVAGAKPTGKELAVDAVGLQCPGPILKLAEGIKMVEPGDTLLVKASDPGFASDVGVWCERTGHTLLSNTYENKLYIAKILKEAPKTAAQNTPAETVSHDKAMVVFSGDLDKALAAFIIANGAAAMDRKVTLFFTFWGLNILRKHEGAKVKKSFIEKMFGAMMPRGVQRLGLSKMHMGGMGSRLMLSIMKKKNIATLDELIASAKAQGVRLVACQMSMDVMGLKPEELIDGVEIGGVATFIGAAEQSDTSLFI